MNDPTLPKAPSPQLARVIYLPCDRQQALLNLATRAATHQSPLLFRRLQRLRQGDKQKLWAALPPETQAALKRLKASLYGQGGAR